LLLAKSRRAQRLSSRGYVTIGPVENEEAKIARLLAPILSARAPAQEASA
jgi:hypothetical protein